LNSNTIQNYQLLRKGSTNRLTLRLVTMHSIIVWYHAYDTTLWYYLHNAWYYIVVS
jgi:hypothetical protein